MPLALVIIGLIMVASGIRNTQGTLSTLLAADFTGSASFMYWIAGMIAVGSIGVYQPLQGTSRMFMGLIFLVFLLSNKGFFAALQAAIQNPTASAAPPTPIASTAQSAIMGIPSALVGTSLGVGGAAVPGTNVGGQQVD